MTTKGLLVRMEAKPGKNDDVQEFLRSAGPLVREEPATMAWFAVRFSASEYGIFDAFADEEGREAHLCGPVASALAQQADELFARPPQIQRLDVLADKLPDGAADGSVSKGLLLTFEPKDGNEEEAANFLRGARAIVEEEPQTIAWFAVRFDDGRYGIFDAFPDNRARFAHLVGRVPRELAKHGLSLLGGLPDMDLNRVLAAKLPSAAVVSGARM